MKFDSLLLGAASVEIFIFIAACTVAIADLFLNPRYRHRLHWGVVIGLLIAATATGGQIREETFVALNGFLISSPLVALLKTVVLLTVAATLSFSRGSLQSMRLLNGDTLSLILMATLGMLVMVSAGHLLSLYLGLELMSLCLYALIGSRRNNSNASEAAIKYFVLGALASGLFLYGASMIYGATGELGISAIANQIQSGVEESKTVLILGLVFILSGIVFKLGCAPFHMWLPDVYQGAPAPITLFIACAPKVAVLSMLLSVLSGALDEFRSDWQQMLMLLAILSLMVGNLTAIAQTHLKRMLAYSAIAHTGYLLLGLLAGGFTGITAASFYISIYALMSIGGFGIIVLLSTRKQEHIQLEDIKGMGARNLLVAISVSILMLSMAGIPPMVGFIAKLTVLQSVINAGFTWLAVVAVFFSLIGAFYYLRVIWLMFFEAPPPNAKAITLGPTAIALLTLISVSILWYGIFPNELITLFAEAAKNSTW